MLAEKLSTSSISLQQGRLYYYNYVCNRNRTKGPERSTNANRQRWWWTNDWPATTMRRRSAKWYQSGDRSVPQIVAVVLRGSGKYSNRSLDVICCLPAIITQLYTPEPASRWKHKTVISCVPDKETKHSSAPACLSFMMTTQTLWLDFCVRYRLVILSPPGGVVISSLLDRWFVGWLVRSFVVMSSVLSL